MLCLSIGTNKKYLQHAPLIVENFEWIFHPLYYLLIDNSAFVSFFYSSRKSQLIAPIVINSCVFSYLPRNNKNSYFCKKLQNGVVFVTIDVMWSETNTFNFATLFVISCVFDLHNIETSEIDARNIFLSLQRTKKTFTRNAFPRSYKNWVKDLLKIDGDLIRRVVGAITGHSHHKGM